MCGCDGVIYASDCAARAAGADLDVEGKCGSNKPGWLPCGAHYCDPKTSYCELVLSDVRALPSDYTCRPLPSGCNPSPSAQAACGCFPHGTRCKNFCSVIDTGGGAGFRLTCVGGA